MRRLGVLYADGSILLVMTRHRTDKEAMAEILDIIEGANKGVKKDHSKAKAIEIEIDPTTIQEVV